MKFNRIEIDNFMAVGTATIDLENKGLVLIQGENLDDSSQNSNGAGKSTIVEALQWAIFNETARGDTGDSVVNRKAGKDCRVLVQLVDGEREYNIIRHRKHKEQKNRVLLLDVTNREDVVDLTLGTDKATQDEITKIIGCSSDVFRAAIYSGQESQIDLPNLTDKHLKTIVEEAAGIDKMQLAHRIARDRYAVVKATLGEEEHRLSLLLAKKESVEQTIEDLRNKSSNHETHIAESIKRLEAQALEYAEQAKALAAELKKSNEEALKAELAEVTDRIAGVKHEQEHHRELMKAVSDAERELSMVKRDFESGRTDATELKARLENVMSEIGTKCDSCGHDITEDSISSRRAAIEENLKAKIASAKESGLNAKKLENMLSEARKALSEHEASMTDISKEVERQKAIQRELDAWAKKRSNVDLAVKDAKTAKAKIDDVKASENPYLKMITEQSAMLDESERKIIAQETVVKQSKAALQTAGCVVDVFSPAGIRAHILDTVTPFLNDRTALYLGTLSDGNISAVWNTQSKTGKGEIREKFEIAVSSATGGSSYKSLSGGEKRKVRLATTLALQDLVSSRASKPIELWIGDEIDDAVDVSGLERLMTVLEEKAKEKGTVLIISHNQLSDWVRQHATVTKKDGSSTITGVLNLERHEELI
ncbi:AAA family ATPase [Vibrio fluvialis]